MAQTFLQGLGEALRGIGASTSDTNFQAYNRQNEAASERDQRAKELTLGLLVKAVENGMPGADEKLKLFQQQNGWSSVSPGPSTETQKMRQAEKDRQFASAAIAESRGRFKSDVIPPVSNQQQDTMNPARTQAYDFSGDLDKPTGYVNDPGSNDTVTTATTNVKETYRPEDNWELWEAHASDMDAAAANVSSEDVKKSLEREADKARAKAKEIKESIKTETKVVNGELVEVTTDKLRGGTTTKVLVPQNKMAFYKEHMSGLKPEDYTKESFKAYEDSVIAGSPRRSLLRENLDVLKAKGGSITINQKGVDKMWENLLGGAGKDINDRKTKAISSAENINTIHEARAQLDNGAYTGFGANAYLGFGRVLSAVGFKAAEDGVANTQAFAAQTGRLVGNLLATGMFGAGTGLSDADREYAQKIAGGEITLDEKAIRKLLDINEKASRALISLHNKEVAGIDKKLSEDENIPIRFSVEMPADYQRPETPAERAKRLEEKYGVDY